MDGQQVWVVAFLLYVYDSVSLDDRRAVIRYSFEGVSAKVAKPFCTVRGRRIFIPNPLRPDECDLLLNSRSASEFTALDEYFIRRGSFLYIVHQIVATIALLILFGLTPILAMYMHLVWACLISIVLTLVTCAFHWLTMWKNRALLGIDSEVIRSDILHVLLCPPNSANSARRMASLRQPRYSVLPCLRAFSPYEARKFEELLPPVRVSA